MSEFSTGDTLRERTDINKYWFWLLLQANRWLLAVGLAFVIFFVFMTWGLLKPVSLHSTMESSDMVETLFSGLIGAIITGTTLVVTINQLVLSQEISSLGSQRSRMDLTMDFRQNTDSLLGMTTPADPADYLYELIETSEQRAKTLRNTLSETENQELHEQVDEYVADLLENANHAHSLLEDADFGTFDVVSPALDYNYDRKIHHVRRLGMENRDSLTNEERSAFRDLLEVLTMYGPVREYIKNLYIQWALVKLSRAILYAALVALTTAGGMVIFVDPTTFLGTVFGIETVLWVVSAAFAISTLPFLLFISFILRLATLAKQTLSVGPLMLS
ncbi:MULTISPECIES: hypothetical protein [Haloarcula]|uniref:Uncharacterized protein n=1 Tax=Haloarcula amylolytica JCM 13557 TaxID=1227452 RepID=M0KPI2_9EURY|nr:hypothetical protein [Haloarcula amylolytica]EMA23282.1 hypothetical protein C442_05451 [Haloarcula amylolytica JCM 13557]